MTRVYVTDPAARVAVRGGKVVVSKEGEIQGQWPLEQVQGVMCFGPVSMTGYAMDALLDQGVPVHRFSMGGRYRGSLSKGDPRELFLRMAQHDRWRDTEFRLSMARALVQTKIRHQRQLLEEVSRRRVALAEPVITEGRAALLNLEGQAGQAKDLSTLMGFEGAASSAFFSAYGALFRQGVEFTGRNRRPPRDPVNALLSLGYTLVGAELAGLLSAAGLDPYLGFLHGFRYGRESLAQDLIEELRAPLIERWVLSLFNSGRVRPENFETTEETGCRMAPDVLRQVMNLYHRHLGDGMDPDCWRFRFQQRVRSLSDAVLDGAVWEGPLGWFDTGPGQELVEEA